MPKGFAFITEKLQQQNRKYYENRNFLFYSSKQGDADIMINCIAQDHEGDEMTCLLFSGYVLTKKLKGYHEELSSIERVGKNFRINADRLHNYYLNSANNPKIIFDQQQLGQHLSNLCEQLTEKNPQRLFYLITANHAMALSIKFNKKTDPQRKHYVCKFYDPNYTNVHLRIVFYKPKDIKNLALENILTKRTMSEYLANQMSLVLLAFEKNLPSKKTIITSINKVGVVDALLRLCQSEGIDLFLRASTLEKIYLLNAPGNYSTPRLWTALANANKENIANMTKSILAMAITNKAKINLLVSPSKISSVELNEFYPGVGDKHIPGFCAFACFPDTVGNVLLFLEIIFYSPMLTKEEKMDVFLGKNAKNSTFIERALHNNRFDLIFNYINLFSKLNFSKNEKLALLKRVHHEVLRIKFDARAFKKYLMHIIFSKFYSIEEKKNILFASVNQLSEMSVIDYLVNLINLPIENKMRLILVNEFMQCLNNQISAAALNKIWHQLDKNYGIRLDEITTKEIPARAVRALA